MFDSRLAELRELLPYFEAAASAMHTKMHAALNDRQYTEAKQKWERLHNRCNEIADEIRLLESIKQV